MARAQCSKPTLAPPLPARAQVNAGATCLLYHLAGAWAAAGPSTLLLDVCCGTGTIGISLARRVKAVVGIDNVASAIEDAKANAELNGVMNATWVCGNAEAVITKVLEVGVFVWRMFRRACEGARALVALWAPPPARRRRRLPPHAALTQRPPPPPAPAGARGVI